jgi:hypothetical protein
MSATAGDTAQVLWSVGGIAEYPPPIDLPGAGLDERERDAVEAATRAIVAKLLHEPTVRLKDATGTSRGDRLAESLRDLFDL